MAARAKCQLLSAAVLLALARLLPAGADAAPAPPTRYVASGSAQAAQVVTDSRPSLTAPVERPGSATLASAEVAYDAAGAISSVAALYDPGATVAGGPTLLCEQFLPCPAAPPGYPLAVHASWPTQPDARTAGTGVLGGPAAPLEVTPAAATARAQAHSASAAASLGSLRALPAAGLVQVGSASSSASQDEEHTTLVVRAGSLLHDIDVGGVLHLDTLEVTSALRLPAHGAPLREQSVVVQGATVAGRQVRIDEHGVHALGSGQATPDATLQAHGIQVRLVSAPSGGPHPQAAAYGLLVTFERTVTQAPEPPTVPLPALPAPPSLNRTYTGTVLLGASAVSAFPVRSPGATLSGPLGTVGPADVDRSAPKPVQAASAVAVHPPVAVPPAEDLAPAPASAPAGPPPFRAAYTVVGLTAAQLRVLYLLLAGSAAAALLRNSLPPLGRRLQGPT